MEYEYCQIDPKTSSVEEIRAEIERLSVLADFQKDLEQGIKVFINSVYGACASPYFVGYNIKVAEAITLQGQDMLSYATKILNRYFRDFWHKDKALHEKMGITEVIKVSTDVVKYGDTDSVYLAFEDVLLSCNYTDKNPNNNGANFILDLYEHRLNEYITKCYEKYAKDSNTENIQSLELEKISKSAIILKKKKYVLDVVWSEPGIWTESLSKIESKGVEIVQSSTPPFARKYLKTLLVDLFREGKNLNMLKFVKKLKSIKEEFKLSDIAEVSKSTSISNYGKFITQDQDVISIAPKCPIHVRAAGCYNYTLNNSKWKGKYMLINSGDKVKWYYAKSDTPQTNVFAYQPGNYPYEFAPDIDWDLQFTKCIIEPINRFIIVMGFGAIPSNLIIGRSLF